MFSIDVDQKISLSLLNQNESSKFYDLMTKNLEYLIKFMPRILETRSVEDTEIVIKSFLQQLANNNGFKAGIYYENVLVGICGFKYIDWQNRKTEIMYWIDKDYSGRGIVSKCVSKLVDIAFNEYCLNKIIIKASEDNIASRKVAEKCGFSLEGKCINDELLNGKYTNIYLFGKTKKESSR